MGGMSTRVQSLVLCLVLFFVAAAAGAQTAPYTRTEIVNATGNPTADGSALLSAISSLSPTPSATNRWLIKLEPGTYDLGVQNDLVMREYVDIEGSGIEATTITGNYEYQFSFVNGLVKGADNSEIRELTMHNDCLSSQGSCITMSNEEASPRITRVRILSDGAASGSRWGIRNWKSAPIIEDVEIYLDSTSSANNYGIVYGQDSKMQIYNTEIEVRGASSYNVGILSREDMDRSEIFNSRVKALLGNHAYAIHFPNSSNFSNDLKVGDTNLIAAAGSSDSAGIKIEGSGGVNGNGSFNIRDSRVYSSSNSIDDTLTTTSFSIINSELTGSGILVRADKVRIGTTQLIGGGTINGTSTEVCAGVYDGNYTFYPSTCP